MLLGLWPALASVQLEIYYPVLERFLARQMFTHDGREYLRGSKTSKCSFAYLENPKIAASGGKLVITARFGGKSAVDLFGGCVGMGDTFDLMIRATPHYENGDLRLKDVEASTTALKNLYNSRVLRGISEELPRRFRYPLHKEARGVLEARRDPNYEQLMSAFHVVSVQAANHALVLILDFRLAVK
ncbi:MAG: hypothetical protein FJW39_14490 [Acidobacteria bacterium]|nr:hypothetical protein [Acidobacteriota bacterium]